MSEHEHEWSVDHQIIEETSELGIPVGECFAYCGCGEELRSDDLFRRVNAVEKLSAAFRSRVETHGGGNENAHYIFNEDLLLWASALEGNNDE